MKEILILALLIISFANCAVHSQADALCVKNVRPTPTPENNDDKELPFSPFQIKELVKKKGTLDISSLWNRLSLDINGFTIVGDDDFDVTSASIDDDNLDDAVLIVWSALDSNARFVLFQQQAVFNSPHEQWKFVGYVDIADQKYHSPVYQVVNGTRNKWLVVKELTGRGTGVSTYNDRWYEIKAGKLKSVLDYVAEGHDINGQLGNRSFSAKIITHSDNEIEVEFAVDWENVLYEDKVEYKGTISQSKKAFYDWNESKHLFVFDKFKSQITKQEIEDVYNFDTIDDDSYLKYTFQNLLEIAQNGDPKQQEWLRIVLDRLNDSPQKRQLERILDK